MAWRRVRLDWLALAVTIAAASAFRFSWLDLMEFKGDEANACRLALHVLGYSEPGIGRFFPTAGLDSSVGVPNPPLFVYIMALPLAVIRSPIAAVVLIAAANVLAVWLTYVAGCRIAGRFVGVTAAALLALSPWGIVFSRKIWAQDLLPLATSLYILQLHALLVGRRPRAGLWLVLITAAAIQLHFSAVILVVVTATALVLANQIWSRWTIAGVAIACILYAPYLAYHAGAILHTTHHHHPYSGPDLLGRLRAAGSRMLDIVGGGGARFLIGRSSTTATVLSIVLGIAAPVGLVAAARAANGDRRRLTRILCLWYALPLVVLTVLQIRPYMHYFIILLPLPYIGLAYLAARIHHRRPAAAVATIALTIAAFLVVDVQFLRTIIRHGGAPGDYGIAYRYEREAAHVMLRDAAGRPFRIEAADPGRARSVERTYRFLTWNASGARGATPSGRPRSTFLLVESFGPSSRPRPRRAHGRITRLGPLLLIESRRN